MTAKPADLFSLRMHRVAVVMVDFQNDFCSRDAGDGTSPPPNINNERPARLANHFAREAAELGAHVIYTRQVLDWDPLSDRQRRWETPAGLCAVSSWGAELCLDPVPESVTVVKHRFDCWQSADFVRELDDRDIDGLIICGVELVGCVLYAILGAEERGYHYLVPTDLVSGRDTGDRTDNKAVTGLPALQPARTPHHIWSATGELACVVATGPRSGMADSSGRRNTWIL